MSMIEDCLAALELGLRYAEAGDAKVAPLVFDDVLREVSGLDDLAAREAEVVAHYGASRLAAANKQEDERRGRLETAIALARKLEAPSRNLDAVDLMANALMNMEENQLALGYCNRAVELTRRNAKAAAGRLWRAGRCYVRVGFPKEAQVALGDAVAVLRKSKKPDPRLAHALLDFGNACLKSDPGAAEPAYREAAELFEKSGRRNPAATAWVNLGVLYGRAERLDEALDWYAKAGKARESDPSASVTQRGNLHNNIASIWRRKKDFARARAEVATAIESLSPVGGLFLAHAFGTRGEIARDEGDAEDALLWFRRAREQMDLLPSPGVDVLIAKLENEAEALERLDRHEEAGATRARIEALRGATAPAAQTLANEAKAKPKRGKGAVIVTLDGVGLDAEIYERFDLGTLENRLETRLAEAGGGELDGHESDAQTTRVFLYGPDARTLFEAIAPVLRTYPLCRGARVELRQGARSEAFALELETLH